MCGIAGYFAFRDSAVPPSIDALTAIRDRMRLRGPDGAGLWTSDDRRVGFAHRRLSIIDLSDAGAQPMLSGDGRHAIVFNGEIYNYAALQAELEEQGVRFRGHSDTEVLLALYARDGDAMLDRLRGMFAIAIWDSERQRLLLARDPYGIKPLYVSVADGVLRFASQVKALLADPAVSRDIDPAGLAGFHLFGSVPEPFTLYRAISAVPAGHRMVVDTRGVGAAEPFASVAGCIAAAARQPLDRDAIHAALRDSVRHHLVADVEVGVFLSGGVDSGAVLGLMHDCGQMPQAATLRFEEFEGQHSDETALAAASAATYGARHHVRTVTADEFRADLPAIFDAMDQPSVDGINSWFVSKAIREAGLKVALSGLGGDELLAGYSTFQTVPATHRRFGALSRLPFAGGAARALLRTLAPGLLRRNPKAAGLFDLPASWAGTYLLRRAVLLPFELDGVMDPALAAEGLARLDPLGLIDRALSPDAGHDVGRVAALESAMYMRNQLLRDADWAGMAHSLEIRVPLVDYTLLGAVAPMMHALRPGVGKAVLATAPATPLPDAVLNRPKTGFSVPVMSWARGRARHVVDRSDSRYWSARVLAPLLGDGNLPHAA
ncbi:asparagine synthase (glutamine-hydrolyzing) [Sphingomonas sp.]|uniref:asparagine synthase (glutamine-hydrolyzing) n=1 Tax=Sphingomonas sp. TaxID=28214 RepID=UPI00307F38B5